MYIYIYIYMYSIKSSEVQILEIENLLQSNPLKSRSLVRRLTILVHTDRQTQRLAACGRGPRRHLFHTRHILPPSEIDLGLFWADFTDVEGKHLFHRIG